MSELITVIYDPENNNIFPDGKVYSEVEKLILKHNNGGTFTTGSFIVIDAIRVYMKRNNIPTNKVIFKNKENGQIIKIIKNYKLEAWPKGFYDTYDEFLCELIS